MIDKVGAARLVRACILGELNIWRGSLSYYGRAFTLCHPHSLWLRELPSGSSSRACLSQKIWYFYNGIPFFNSLAGINFLLLPSTLFLLIGIKLKGENQKGHGRGKSLRRRPKVGCVDQAAGKWGNVLEVGGMRMKLLAGWLAKRLHVNCHSCGRSAPEGFIEFWHERAMNESSESALNGAVSFKYYLGRANWEKRQRSVVEFPIYSVQMGGWCSLLLVFPSETEFF